MKRAWHFVKGHWNIYEGGDRRIVIMLVTGAAIALPIYTVLIIYSILKYIGG